MSGLADVASLGASLEPALPPWARPKRRCRSPNLWVRQAGTGTPSCHPALSWAGRARQSLGWPDQPSIAAWPVAASPTCPRMKRAPSGGSAPPEPWAAPRPPARFCGGQQLRRLLAM